MAAVLVDGLRFGDACHHRVKFTDSRMLQPKVWDNHLHFKVIS